MTTSRHTAATGRVREPSSSRPTAASGSADARRAQRPSASPGAAAAAPDGDATARRAEDPLKTCCDVEGERAILAWRTWIAPWSI